MNVVNYDIAKDILKSQFGFAIDSETAKLFIEKNIISVQCETLFLIDFTGAVFDHYFARTFGDLFLKISNKDTVIDAIFLLKEYQIDDFLLGLLDYQNIPYSKETDENIKDFFISKNFFVKLMIDKNKITFFTSSNTDMNKILDFINLKLETDFDEIYKQKILAGEDISPVINELVKLRSIYSNSSKKYFSVYKYLNEQK